ncbi:MAG: DNA gyrase subunit A [Actinobacteria bacterium]|nr:MAG: DNA gyrase subunit A [Actinomycetota bacterium]
MGKYHPHDSSSIYDALVRLAQPFSLRYPLVDPQGNFGSIDDDPPAAERYTECRLARLATEMLRDIDSDTVDFGPNYDESRREPLVLPARFPNLLVNGSSGIAVGMATNIPPHHLGETIDALVAMIDEPAIDVDRLMTHVKGPDFPTSAIIVGREGIREAYRSGRGRIIMRARAHIEELRGGRTAVVVTELPYGVRKGGDEGVITKIADLVKEGTLTEVADLKDLSDKSGMRIEVHLKRDVVPQVALNKLFKHTALQTTFGYNAVALVDGVPRTLGLRDLLYHYLEHQREVVTRRLKYDLRQAEKRAHVLEGYLIALDNLDEVIALIRGADDTDSARAALMERFSLSEIQAQAILDLRLRALTGLERQRVEEEYKELKAKIAELRAILGDEARIDSVIREELLEVKSTYSRNDDRRTEIVAAEGELELEDLIAEEDMVIAITRSNYIKRLPVTTYREQRRGGIGVMGMDMKEEDYIEHLFVASTHDYILFFTNVGKVYRLKVHELPLGSRQSKGRAIQNLLPFRQGEQVRAVIQTRDFEEAEFLVFATKNGVVKKTKLSAYNTPLRADGIIAIRMREGDELIGVRHSTGRDDVLMVSRKGQAIRFHEQDVRAMGRDASGVQGMRLRGLDEVIALIRGADDTDSARAALMERFSLSEIQAQAILDLRLRALTGLERQRVEEEYKELKAKIADLRAILGDEARIDSVIREELLEVKSTYSRNDDRRTEIVAAEGELELEDLIAEEDMVIAITRSNYIKRLPVTTYREQRRGGIGVMGMDMKEEDYIEHLFVASTHDYILFFTNVGKVYRLKVHELPLGSRQSKGRAIQNLLPFRQGEQVRAVIQTRDFEEAEFLVFATKNGVVKKTKLSAYNTPLRADGIIAIRMREGDELIGVRHSTGRDDVLMVSRKGQAIRFHEQDVRAMGRDASGVQGMRLRGDDEVIAVNIAHDDADVLVVTENGFGKRTLVRDYPVKGRGGMGVKTVQLTEAKGQLAGSRVVRDGYQVMLISTGGTVIRMAVDDIKRSGRSTQGVIVMRLREGERVSALAPVVDSDDAKDADDTAPSADANGSGAATPA